MEIMTFYDGMERYKDRLAAICDQGDRITYQNLAEAADEFGKVIKEHRGNAGDQDRQLIFCLCENTIASIAGYIGCLRAHEVPLLLKADIDRELLQNLMEIYLPQYLFLPERLGEGLEDYRVVWEWKGYTLYKTGYETAPIAPELALLLTTSGSTGSPKLVRQSYRNITSNAEAIAEYLKLDETERPITTLPMNYTYGLSIINSHLLVGATLLLTDAAIMQREFWTFFREEEATSFGGVPYTYEMLKRLRFLKMDLPSLRTMTQAGGKLLPELHREFAEYAREQGRQFVVMYGQTEATARMAYLPADKALEKYGSMGIAIPRGKLWLKDTNGQMITEPGTVGELVYEGENVTLGYAECREDLRKADERHGILETGDMAKMDEEGYFYIVGRKKRFLKIYGNRVNLDEVERMVKDAYRELDCACGGTDDHLYIFVTTEDMERKQEIRHFVYSKTGLNSAAFHVTSVEAIPKNEAGKTLYKELESYYDEL